MQFLFESELNSVLSPEGKTNFSGILSIANMNCLENYNII